jgi:hypothetical protein
MFFLWDVIFGTGLIPRHYPKTFVISHYEGDEWYAQFLWLVSKSRLRHQGGRRQHGHAGCGPEIGAVAETINVTAQTNLLEMTSGRVGNCIESVEVDHSL